VPCFYIHRDWRPARSGLAASATRRKASENRGARIIESYPVSRKYGKEIPAAFAYTGVVPMFTDVGFNPTNKRKSWRQRVRKNSVGRRKSSK
jgi:hypothetical protein